jgi:hypothetical protein
LGSATHRQWRHSGLAADRRKQALQVDPLDRDLRVNRQVVPDELVEQARLVKATSEAEAIAKGREFKQDPTRLKAGLDPGQCATVPIS